MIWETSSFLYCWCAHNVLCKTWFFIDINDHILHVHHSTIYLPSFVILKNPFPFKERRWRRGTWTWFLSEKQLLAAFHTTNSCFENKSFQAFSNGQNKYLMLTSNNISYIIRKMWLTIVNTMYKNSVMKNILDVFRLEIEKYLHHQSISTTN